MRRATVLASALSTAAILSAPLAVARTAPAPVADLVARVDLPYDRFTLPNGLTVLVHTDRKAPIVAVSVWYGVGSKNEPRGRTGFAHLFEHLMFYGSQHNPGNFFAPLTAVGGSDANGTTWFDRTNYFETVPTGALDRALMMESDRMGWLLPAMTQARVDAQRAVVKNEKRQDDNQPFGLVEYEQTETLYPAGHPYHHSTIGSMEDLDKASLDDVKGWFHDHYGPNNAIVVLAGDIDLATAKDKVTRWFGAIAPGPKVQPVIAPVVPLTAPVEKTIHDTVATTRLMRVWAIPGLDNPDYLPLRIGAMVLGGLSSSRLADTLVHGREIAIDASADVETFAQAGNFSAQTDIKPGQDAKVVGAALDAEIRRLIDDGPTPDELQRASVAYVGGTIRALEAVGGFSGQAPRLAQGLLYSGDPAQYRVELQRTARLTPDDVRQALQKWLRSPAFSLTIVPGARTAGGESRGGDNALPPASPPPPVPAGLTALAGDGDRSHLPAAAEVPPLPFPAIERTTLTNGIKVYFARRSAVPVVQVRLSFDAGYAADPLGRRGTEALLLKLMDEGTQTLTATDLARARERLGATISDISGPDQTAFQLDALAPNLSASLGLLRDFVRDPGLREADLVRVRGQQLSAIDAETQDPNDLSLRVLYPAIYGADHPYGTSPTGIGTKAIVAHLTRADLAQWHQTWLRPDRATLFVTGDTTLDAVKPLLEQNFGDWRAPAGPAPRKDFTRPLPATHEHIILIDRPGVPQAQIAGGEVLDALGTDDLVTLRTANEVLGGSFLARFTQNLREDKGWSYGTYSAIGERENRVALRIYAPVQTDQAGPAIAELRKEIAGYLGPKGTTATELDLAATGSARQLPDMFETSGAVLDGIAKIVQFNRPDDYYTRLPDRYRAMTTTMLDTAARAKIDPARIVWVVVGDAATIRPQLAKLGLPVEEVKAGE
jgi:predicted Zn-dependent peptidase